MGVVMGYRYPLRSSKPLHDDKILREGQPCRKCGYPVLRKEHQPGYDTSRKAYYFEWWFVCPNSQCKTAYFVEDAKRAPEPTRQPRLF